MKCINHTDTDAVVSCGSCKAGICKECENNTVFRIDNVALCKRCNIQVASDYIIALKSQNRYLNIKIIGGIVLLAIGIIYFAYSFLLYMNSRPLQDNLLNSILGMLIVWGIANIFSFFRKKSDNRNIKAQVKDALLEVHYPGSSLIGKLIGFIIGYLISALLLPVIIILSYFSVTKNKKLLIENNDILNTLTKYGSV